MSSVAAIPSPCPQVPAIIATMGVSIPGWGIATVTLPAVCTTAAMMLVTAAQRSGRSFSATMYSSFFLFFFYIQIY